MRGRVAVAALLGVAPQRQPVSCRRRRRAPLPPAADETTTEFKNSLGEVVGEGSGSSNNPRQLVFFAPGGSAAEPAGTVATDSEADISVRGGKEPSSGLTGRRRACWGAQQEAGGLGQPCPADRADHAPPAPAPSPLLSGRGGRGRGRVGAPPRERGHRRRRRHQVHHPHRHLGGCWVAAMWLLCGGSGGLPA